MSSKIVVTIWERWEKGNTCWKFNHIQKGVASTEEPKPKSEHQKKYWAGGNWRKRFGTIVDGVVIEDE